MEHTEQVTGLIKRNYSSMTGVEKKIADYILESQNEVIYMTTKAFAARIQVSEGSIIKFASKLGFTGFSQLKIRLAAQQAPENNYMFDTVSPTDSPKAAFKKMADNAWAAFLSTYEAIREEELYAVIHALTHAKGRIEIYGVGSSAVVAEDIYYRLMRLGIPIYAVTDPHISSVSASMLDETSVAIGISHSGRTIETVSAMEIAKAHKAVTICMTGYASSPLSRLRDHSLITATKESETHKEAVTSRLTGLLVFDSICAYISSRMEEQSVSYMDNVIDIIGKHRLP